MRACGASRCRSVVLMAALAVVPTAWTSWSGDTPAAWAETQTISDGATVRAPDRVRQGEKIKITGRGWTTSNGHGSVIAIKFDDGEVTPTTPVTNPATGDSVTDPSVVAAVGASAKGSFSIAVAVPDGVGWTAGTRHSVRLLTGKLLSDDSTRSVALTFDIVAGPRSSRPSPSIPVSTAAADSESEASALPTTASVAPPAKEHPTVSSSAAVAEGNASAGIGGSASPTSASSAPPPSPATASATQHPTQSAVRRIGQGRCRSRGVPRRHPVLGLPPRRTRAQIERPACRGGQPSP